MRCLGGVLRALGACAVASAIAGRGGHRCSVVLNEEEASPAAGDFDYVCDTCGWFHGDGGNGFPASAGSGGCHSYMYMRGTAPCSEFGPCDGCVHPQGEVVYTLKMDSACSRGCSGETVPCGR